MRNTILSNCFSMIVSITALLTGCDDKGNSQDLIAGSYTLEVTAKHHSWPVRELSVFLAVDKQQFPGYDSSAYRWKTITDSSGIAAFNRLFPGDYYLYARGYDSTWGDTVIGYMPLRITAETQPDNTIEADLYVSE